MVFICFGSLFLLFFVCSSHRNRDGLLDCVLVLCCPPSAKMDNVIASIKQFTDAQHAIERGERPGESHYTWTEKKRKQLLIFPYVFFLTSALCLSAGRGVLRLTRLPRQDRGPVSGRNRSAASCRCTVLGRAL